MDPVTSTLLKGLSPLARFAFGWLAGFRSLQTVALRGYQRRLRTYRTFRPVTGAAGELSMREMYLPVKLQLTGRSTVTTIEEELARNRRVIVTGEPGSGKTMLLHHLLAQFADGGRRARAGRIPVLVSLQHLDESRDLKAFLIRQLKDRYAFFRVEKFLTRALQKPILRLLLDGLDEVVNRNRVVTRINEFITEYPACEIVVTCRTAVREEALHSRLPSLTVAELDDDLIKDFVRRWFGDRTAVGERLLEELYGTRQVVPLARIPLLLTMMVRTYGDPVAGRPSFPSSRSQFFRQAADFLLTPWHGESVTTPERILDKRDGLRRLALFEQDNAGDGAVIGRDHAIELITKRGNDDRALELLQEIVERSGLLRRADEGYEFPHQSFREFFAAEQLRKDAVGLLARFRADPDRWQESVVLWCGIADNATAVIAELLRDRSLAVLECVGEAGKLDDELVDAVIDTFSALLDHAEKDSPQVRAFGIAAAGSPAVFAFLEREFTRSDGARRMAAAHALAATDLPQAAVLLSSGPDARDALQAMRDVAVDVLASRSESSIDTLAAIGTRAAAHALIGLLWDNDEQIAGKAAWALAAMPTAYLDGYVLGDGQPAAPHYMWVWEPYAETPGAQIIISQVARLLLEGPVEVPAEVGPTIDDRLAVALGVIATNTGALSARRRITKERASLLKEVERRGPREQCLAAHASTEYLWAVLGQISTPTKDNWRRMHRQGPGLWPAVWTLSAVGAAEVIGLVVLTVIQTIRTFFPPGGFTLAPVSWIVTGVLWIGDMVSRGVVALDGLLQNVRVDGFELRWYIWGALGFVLFLILLGGRHVVAGFLAGLVALVLISLLLIMPSVWLHGALGSWWVVAFVWVLCLCIPAAALSAYVQDQRDRNPLKGGLSPSSTPRSAVRASR